MAEKNQRAQALADDWLYWLMTRRFFGPPPSKNILAMMSDKSRPSREPPNARLSAELSAFHVAVCGLPDHLGAPFMRIYCMWPNEPVKTLAFDAGISRDAYYERAHSGAAQAMRNTKSILAMVQNLGLVKCNDSARQDSARHNDAVMVSF